MAVHTKTTVFVIYLSWIVRSIIFWAIESFTYRNALVTSPGAGSGNEKTVALNLITNYLVCLRDKQ